VFVPTFSGPMKRVYKKYEDDSSIPVPKRTAMRHASARQHLFGNNCSQSQELDGIQQLSPRLSAATDYSPQFTSEVDTERLWGPLWSWSCFPFEDWNSALLQSVHGTGDVTRQYMRVREVQMKLYSINLDGVPKGDSRSYLAKMRNSSKPWSVTNISEDVYTAGALQSCNDLPEDEKLYILNATGCANIHLLKKSLRVQVNGQKLYSECYTRMKKRICNVVRCKNGQLRKVLYYLVETDTNNVFAFAQRIEVHNDCFIHGAQHVIRVTEPTCKVLFPVEDIAEKVFLVYSLYAKFDWPWYL
jgi:hypothetical protein